MWRFLSCPRVLVHGTLKYICISAFHLVQPSGRLRETSEGLKPFGGCLPLAPFFKIPQLYSRLWAQCRPAAQPYQFGKSSSQFGNSRSRIGSAANRLLQARRGSFYAKNSASGGPSMAERSYWHEICTEPHRELPAVLWSLDLYQYIILILFQQSLHSDSLDQGKSTSKYF